MRNGAVDFLEKPFDDAQIVDCVRRVSLRAAMSGTRIRSATGYERRKETLTPREREVLDEMITGKTSKNIARVLGASYRTIEIHRARVMAKMGAKSLADLVRMAFDTQSRPPS